MTKEFERQKKILSRYNEIWLSDNKMRMLPSYFIEYAIHMSVFYIPTMIERYITTLT